jgi:fermentation-respiration switch protein FrsA (DUF1100 family)
MDEETYIAMETYVDMDMETYIAIDLHGHGQWARAVTPGIYMDMDTMIIVVKSLPVCHL